MARAIASVPTPTPVTVYSTSATPAAPFRAVALPMFLSAKDGHHTKLPPVRMRRCRHAELTFEEPDYPIQADGEPVVASRIEVDILAGALEVWHPTR